MKFLIIDIRQRVGKDPNKLHYAVERLRDDLASRDIACDTCHYDEIELLHLDDTFTILAKGEPLSSYSHVIIRGHRTQYEYMLKRYIVEYTEEHGIKVQNAAFMKLFPHYNKLIQMVLLAKANLPFVDSYYTVDGRYWEKETALQKIGFPMIYKHTEGAYRIEKIDGVDKTKKNVFLVNNKEELHEECLKRDEPEERFLTEESHYFIQRYVDIGEDYRAIMLGGKFLSGWKREATRNFLTVSKGEYSLFDDPSPEFLKIAERTSTVLKADYCAVDIIYVDEKPYILEVNMNPGFKSFETKIEGCDVDVAGAIIDNMLEK